jgi:hypothetical protein
MYSMISWYVGYPSPNQMPEDMKVYEFGGPGLALAPMALELFSKV